jgi:hypothetical protein
MNLWHRVYEQLRAATNSPHVGPADAVRAIDYIEKLCGAVVQKHHVVQALLADRKVMRRAMVGKAFDDGIRGLPEEEVVVIDWPFDPADHDPDEPKVEAELALEALRKKVVAPAKPRLVALH